MSSLSSETLAAARARLQAARSPASSSARLGSDARSGFLTPRVAPSVISLERGLDGLGEFSSLLTGGGVTLPACL